MKRSIENRLSELYLANQEMICEGLPEGINGARREFLESFNLLSLPTTKAEAYRHCDMQELFAGEWEHYFTPPKREEESDYHIPIGGLKLESLNGFYGGAEQLTVLDNGVIYGSLAKAVEQYGDLVLKHYNKLAENEKTAVTALNSLFMQDGTFVYVPKGVEVDEPFVLTIDRD